MIEGVKHLANPGKYIPSIFAALVAGVTENVELDIKELLELQTHSGTLQTFGILGIMNRTKSLVAPHQVSATDDEIRQGLWQGGESLDERLRQTFDGP